ncbi:MAG: Plug domain-containing protein, partial [Alistipes sp.]|nr:Plug domain-containing protein [Alistipes sp.]
MRPLLLLLLPSLCCALPVAAQRDTVSRTVSRTVAIERVDIAGFRPLKRTGMQSTEIDSLVLRETISSSLADVLSSGSTIFIKSYGRATLSTASFRGTAPSHTQVTWNGMKVNSPMLGQVDFSLIPAYLVDDATLYHGASSVAVTGGGLGGAVALDNRPLDEQGFALRFVQGVGSFTTFDEFLRASYGGRRWSGSTRLLYSTSRNDFRYHNYHSKALVTDDDGRVVGSYVPLERNRNGGFGDLHLMQELYRTGERGGRLSLAAWYLDSNRGLPMTSADRNASKRKKEEQDERTLRVVAGGERLAGGLKLSARGGYTYT